MGLGWGGVLPFAWTADTPKAFERFSQGGTPVVVPIIQIILSRAPDASKAWVDTLLSWEFERVLPAHFDSPIKATPETLKSTSGCTPTGALRLHGKHSSR